MTRDKTSNSPNICGQCGARASYPERFTAEEAEDLDGVFNVCHECESECVGTGAWTDADRWIWAPAKDAQLGRKRLNAMLDDAEMAGMMREQMEDW